MPTRPNFVNTPVSLELPTATGGAIVCRQCRGLAFDPATRILSGMPTAMQAATSYTYTVTDTNTAPPNDSATLSFTITVNAANTIPIAVIDQGATLVVNSGTGVTLNSTGSSDPDPGDAIDTYTWRVATDGTPALTLATTTTINAASLSFTAPTVTTQQTYTIGLIVNDGEADSMEDTIAATVNPNTAPPAPAVANQMVTAGTPRPCHRV